MLPASKKFRTPFGLPEAMEGGTSGSGVRPVAVHPVLNVQNPTLVRNYSGVEWFEAQQELNAMVVPGDGAAVSVASALLYMCRHNNLCFALAAFCSSVACDVIAPDTEPDWGGTGGGVASFA